MRRIDTAQALAVLLAALLFAPASVARAGAPDPAAPPARVTQAPEPDPDDPEAAPPDAPEPDAPEADAPEPDAPEPEAPAPRQPAPPAPPAPAPIPPSPPAPPSPPSPPAPRVGPPLRPLDTTLNHERWRAMSREERLTFLDGAVLALTDVTVRLKQALAGEGRIPPDTLKALVEFVEGYYPKLPPLVYMQEMDRIYTTAEGQNLSMMDCFRTAFRRMNGR